MDYTDNTYWSIGGTVLVYMHTLCIVLTGQRKGGGSNSQCIKVSDVRIVIDSPEQ